MILVEAASLHTQTALEAYAWCRYNDKKEFRFVIMPHQYQNLSQTLSNTGRMQPRVTLVFPNWPRDPNDYERIVLVGNTNFREGWISTNPITRPVTLIQTKMHGLELSGGLANLVDEVVLYDKITDQLKFQISYELGNKRRITFYQMEEA